MRLCDEISIVFIQERPNFVVAAKREYSANYIFALPDDAIEFRFPHPGGAMMVFNYQRVNVVIPTLNKL